MTSDDKNNIPIHELADILRVIENGGEIMSERKRAYIKEQSKIVSYLAIKIKAKERQIQELQKNLLETYQPEGRRTFLEVGKFEGYNALQYFYGLAEFLHGTFREPLERLVLMGSSVKKTIGLSGKEEDSSIGLRDKDRVLHQMCKEIVNIAVKGTLPFEEIVKHAYQRAMDQYRYLQKRFMDVGIDDTRVYKAPWEQDETEGFDLNRVPYVKIELIKGNPILTDLLLDIADNLPKQYTKREKEKGKKKLKEVKYTDSFEVERASRVLIELANPTYQGYIQDPRKYLNTIANSIDTYYEIMSKLEGHLMKVIEKRREDPNSVFEISSEFKNPIADPQVICSRLRSINYNAVQPSEEDVKPSGHRLKGGILQQDKDYWSILLIPLMLLQ